MRQLKIVPRKTSAHKLQTELKRHYTPIVGTYHKISLRRVNPGSVSRSPYANVSAPGLRGPGMMNVPPAFAYAGWCTTSGRNQRWRIMFRFVTYKFALSYTHRLVNNSLCHLEHIAQGAGGRANWISFQCRICVMTDICIRVYYEYSTYVSYMYIGRTAKT